MNYIQMSVLAAALGLTQQNGVLANDESNRIVHRVAIVGCHQQDDPAPALFRYLQAKPDVTLWVGDNVYADTADDITHIERCYSQLEANPAFRKLREQSIYLATWDDHDFGMNNDGKNYRLKEESRELFRKFWNHEHRIPADQDGVYHSQTFGQGDEKLQVILLDGRFNRDDEGDNNDTLGSNQWKWLKAELQKPARLRFLVCGYQFLLDRDAKFETWAKFPQARERLFRLIRDTGAEGVVFVAGDQHYGEASRLAGVLGYDAVELMFCGINQYEPHVLNTSRVTPVAHAEHSYALVDIQWKLTTGDDGDVPHFVFRCYDALTDKQELSYRVNLSELTHKGHE